MLNGQINRFVTFSTVPFAERYMDIKKILDNYDIILTEAAIIESLRRSGNVDLHPRLENALLIYEEAGKKALSNLYQEFINIACKQALPITLCTPTWRANQERISTAHITKDVNGDAVKFLKHLKDKWGSWAANIFIGGLVGCKNDCYKPDEGLSKNDAKEFHFWQINQLANAGVDFLIGATLPTLPEATGIALSMAETNIPYIISFVINREGRILDGNSLEHSFREIDAACSRPPLGYMINCAYPSFLNAHKQTEVVMSRLIGFQANASSLDHSELDGAETLQTDDISDWGNLMIELNKKYGVKILGGCCGTNSEHLQYIAQN
ncbi:MAG: homocysteine S-methyltransferase family protein, partial [Desulfobacterium sp.]|nr:homocysteine S-methyltransferase family protein [Desulfobacterium sp.]